MRTLVVSDLHLGARFALLTRPVALEALTARLKDVDRLVLLGDTLELRLGPARDALAAAEAPLRAIGEAMGEKPIVIVPGNHDHALAAGWLDWRGRRDSPPPLELDNRVQPHHASWIAKRVATFLAPAQVEIAYPGVFVRDDVYALHGHYLDVHTPLPTFERLFAGLMGSLTGRVREVATAEEYERTLAPMYAWIHQVSQRRTDTRRNAGDGVALRVWKQLRLGPGERTFKQLAMQRGFPVSVAAVNRAGLGPVSADVTGDGMRRAALTGITEVTRRLRVPAQHVIFGHSHRAGPFATDIPSEWRTPAGIQLHNTGSWTYERSLVASENEPSNPYWPGRAIVVEDGPLIPPRLEGLLDGRSPDELEAV